jgi:pilus assembly protein CpaC
MNAILRSLFAGIFVILCTLAFARDARAQKRDELNVSIGETKTIAAPGVEKFSNGSPEVADIRPDPGGSSFLVTGKKSGSTTLLLIRRDGSQQTYEVTVSVKPMAIIEKELTALIADTPGVRLRRVGPRFFIEGGVSREGDLKRIQQVAALYGEQVLSLVVVGGGAGESKLLMRIDFFFVQYEKNANYAVGIGWPATIGGTNGGAQVTNRFSFDFLGRTTTAAQAAIVNQPLPRLDIGARNGWAKVLKQATVITGNGNEAKFSSGAEQNFLQNAGFTVGLTTLRYGTEVSVLPRYDSNSRDLELRIQSDISDLVPAVGGTVPGRNITKLDTLVTLKLGQALVLSGIKTQTRRQDTEGLPFLSEIPVLGLLFGSLRKEDNEREGAIFVIPSIVDSVPKSSLEMIRNAVGTYKDFSGDMKELDTFQVQPPSAK